MKAAVIFFHSNIHKIYPQKWIDDCISSIQHQTYKNFDVLELNYGPPTKKLYPGGVYYNVELKNHSEAQNWILDKAFEKYDVVFNTNMDDNYALDRVENQLPFMSEYDIVTCDMKVIDKDNKVTNQHIFSDKSISDHFILKDHNIIAHPGCCYSRRFWTHPQNPGFQWKNFPRDDFELWKWAWSMGFKFKIVPEFLLNYRRHEKNVSNKENAQKLINES